MPIAKLLKTKAVFTVRELEEDKNRNLIPLFSIVEYHKLVILEGPHLQRNARTELIREIFSLVSEFPREVSESKFNLQHMNRQGDAELQEGSHKPGRGIKRGGRSANSKKKVSYERSD